MIKIRLSVVALTLATASRVFSQTPPPKYVPASVERGRATFASTCGFCHGTSAKGGEKGPDLLRSVLVLHDEHGESIGPVILNGRPDKGMPHFALSAAQITDIANFLHASVLSAEDRDNYKILNIVTGDAKAGAAYFAANCQSCHSVTGDLKGIAAKYDPATLQGRFIEPNQTQSEGITVTVTLPSGESFTGVPVNYDDFNVSLRDAKGDYHAFRRTKDTKVELHNRFQAHLDLVLRYSDDDIHNLTAYLVTLK